MTANIVHVAGPVSPGDETLCCARCGFTLQAGPAIHEWPPGAPVVVSANSSGGQIAVFEGASPVLPQCSAVKGAP